MAFIDKINPDVPEALKISDVHIHEHKPYILVLDKGKRYRRSPLWAFLQELVNIT